MSLLITPTAGMEEKWEGKKIFMWTILSGNHYYVNRVTSVVLLLNCFSCAAVMQP